MEIRVLGPFDTVGDDQPFTLRRRRARALLALLALHANEVVALDTLIDELWPERPPPTARHSIEVYVSEVRKALRTVGVSDALRTSPPGYMLALRSEQLDVGRFEDLAAQGRRALAAGEPATAAEKLAEALALWRGPALADLASAGIARTEIERLEELRVSALEDRVEADLALGRHATLVVELRALVTANPFRERLQGQLMLALYRAGRQAEALGAFAALRQTLADDLGLEPSSTVRKLQAAILRQDPSLELAHAPSPSAAGSA